MTYDQTLEYLYSLLPVWHRVGKAAYKDNLDNSLALDDYFGHKHRNYNTIHIAGTNGKGSVSHMTASVLQVAGFKTGLYTSPHLKDFRERIRVNSEMIPESYVIRFVEENAAIIEMLRPSFFELTVAMAFSFFADAGVDVAVIETGLGGRLDSTNIIKPVLSVITNIGHDHMDLLGDTIEKIAKEKAGIIKPGVPVVISETDTSTMELFVRKAGECDAEILFADTICNCHLDKTYDSNELRSFRIIMNGNDSYSGTVPLGGDYQAKNIQAVFAIFRMLNERFKISIDQVLKGIAEVKRNTGLRGRWEILRYNPLVIADTGHNREGLEYVISQLTALNKTRLHIVVGFVADKDLASVLPLFPAEAEYYFTRARAQRALDQDTLKREAGKYGLHGDSYPDVKSAMDSALLRASPSDLIFIGGSTYIVAEVI